MRCKQCVLPEFKPDIILNEAGVCNVCVDAKRRESAHHRRPLVETDLIKLLNRHSGKRKYDCLVMCSGGKDSTAALYYMKQRYKLNPLAFTFDHGFETEIALENVRNAVTILDVDWLYHKSKFMHTFFREIIRRGAKIPICPVCSIWYMDTTYDFATRLGIPLIISGWTRGQMQRQTKYHGVENLELNSMSTATTAFINQMRREFPAYRRFPGTMSEVRKNYRRITVISPHWFIKDSPEAYVPLITRELKWKSPQLSYPAHSTNCLLNFVNVYLSLAHYGFTHYHIEMSKLIRDGKLSRNEALEALSIDFNDPAVASAINTVLEKLGLEGREINSYTVTSSQSACLCVRTQTGGEV